MAWGRLALIHAAAESDETLDKMAMLWGYQRVASIKPIVENLDSQPVNKSDTPAIIEPTEQPHRPPALFIGVSKSQQLASTNSGEPVYINNPDYTLKPDSKGSYCFKAAKPLLSMARLIPLLHNGLGQMRRGNNIDLARLSTQLAKGHALRQLPYLPRLTWSQRLHIIVDARLDLEPYWLDFIFIINELKKQLGQEAVTAIRFDEDTVTQELAYCLPYPTTSDASWQIWQVPADDVAVLILSDLKARHWQHLLKRLQQRTAPILTLSPSVNTPPVSICQLARPNPLNDAQLLPRHPYQQGFKLPELSEPKRLEIFALLSVLPLIDVALLRRLRLELNWGGSELEHFIWQHHDARNNGLGIYFPKDIAETYRPHYPKDTEQTQAFWNIVHDHHEQAFQGLKCLEGLNQYAMEQYTKLDVKDYYQRLVATLKQTPEHAANYTALQAQAKTVIALMPKRVLDTELNNTIHHLAAFAYADDIRAENWQPLLNQDLNIEKLRFILPAEQQQLKDWYIVQTGQGQFHCIQTAIPPKLIITKLSAILPPVQIMADGKQRLLEHQTITLAKNETINIKTEFQHLELKAIKKPGLASRIWRDAQGLFISIDWCGSSYTLPWCVTENSDWGWIKSPTSDMGWFRSPFNKDNYGIYADLDINNVIQRFRWIEAGSFLMGSPPDEPERNADEVQHHVTLTQGYWLADTACTLALWLAVMGISSDYPAPFQEDLNNPIENVSWNEVQKFLTRFNQLMPYINARLPTEAEWEYACRAGTNTPFCFGNNITPEQVNYDGYYPYDDGKKGLFREKTVPAKSLPPNNWGLYEMHGNVWEWCNDWYAEYPNEAVTNPTGATDGNDHVMRGGSWYLFARRTRSAIRNFYSPDFRDGRTGFRFALGSPNGTSRNAG